MLTLEIPPLWENDWKMAVEGAEGEMRQIIVLQAQMATLLEEVQGSKPTPSVVGWLIMWTRLFHILRSAEAALAHSSGYGLEVLIRIIYGNLFTNYDHW